MDASFTSRVLSHLTTRTTTPGTRILLVLGLALVAHITVWLVRKSSEWAIVRGMSAKSRFGAVVKRPKIITIHRLIISGVIFGIYFFALGLILQEMGINLTAYLASASVLGLAISFGSQGLVQDIVIGLTLIILDAMDVGDMVEIVGTATVVGIVEEIGLRFTQVTNFYNQRVLIPNRTIANVSRFPHGGVDVYADVWIPENADRDKIATILEGLASGMRAQFSEIILNDPVVGEPESRSGGHWNFYRILFRIWPGQGNLIETVFRQEVIKAMKAFDPNYADWQVPVTYRAGSGTSPGRRINQALKASDEAKPR